MHIGNKFISENDLYFWVEEGQASLGNFDTAIKFIDIASEIGADGIEFQLAIPEEFYISTHPYIEHYKRIEYTRSQLKRLIQRSKKDGIDFIATVLSKSLIPFLAEQECSAFVINASDVNNPGIIDPVIASQIPFFISLPLASEKEIDWIINRCIAKDAKNLALMQGQHTMASGEHGVLPEHTNLGFISTLKRKYRLPVGYIDHSSGSCLPSIARATGANFISKHLFLNENDRGPDWFVCQNPDKLKATIEFTRNISLSLTINKKELAPGENMEKQVMRRSIVAAHDIPIGTVISFEMLDFKRPGGDIPPNDYEKLLGMTSLEFIKKDELIKLSKLKP